MGNDRDLLKDFVDIHVHAGPSLMDRAVDAWDMAEQTAEAGYRGFVVKDHHYLTAPLARVVEQHFGGGVKVFGGQPLNHASGGPNPAVVDAAIGLGARLVWLPTVSSLNHKIKHSGHGLKFPSLAKKMSVSPDPMVCVQDGRLIPEVWQVLEVVAQHSQVVLGTGHGNRDEVDAYVRAAAELGVERILVNHPHYMVDASLEDMRAWTKLGAVMEFNAVLSVPDSKFYCVSVARVMEYIKGLDPAKVVLSSDYGQAGNGSPVDGMAAFVRLLLEEGLGDDELETMLIKNPAALMDM